MEYGAFGFNSNLNFRGNTIGEDELGAVGNVETGVFIFAEAGNNFIFKNTNRFLNKNYGLVLGNAQLSNEIIIENNIFDLYTPSTSVLYAGAILLSDAQMSGINQSNRIEGNILNLHSKGTGIGLYNFNDVSIINNQINFLNTFDPTDFGKGIYLHQSSNNYLSENNIFGSSGTNAQSGIYVLDGDLNNICCNSTNGTSFGTQFKGICTETNLRHTSHNNNNIGLQCDPNTRIGQQQSAGNMWMNSTLLKARHLSLNPEDVAESRFEAAPSQGPTYFPNPNELLVVSGVQWFFTGATSSSCIEDEICDNNEQGLLEQNDNYINKLINGDFYYGNYPETSEWESAWALYRSQRAAPLQDHSSWSTEGQLFYTQQTQNNTILHKVVENLQSLEEFMVHDAVLDSITKDIQLASDQLYNLDITFEEGEEPKQAYLNQRSNLLSLYEIRFIDYFDALINKQVQLATLTSQLKQQNDNILTNHEAAKALIKVSGAYLGDLANYTDKLDPVLESELKTIAQSCPQRYGSAVGRAQSLLIQYNVSFTPTIQCANSNKNFQSLNESSSLSSSNLVEEDIVIYPNPASETLNIQLPVKAQIDNSRIQLVNVHGQIMLDKPLLTNHSTINTTEIESGIYWIRVQLKNKVISRRLIIN
ncbi:MAG: T9SS type A sorting domain-containing protein [Bacteroidota bacterium]